MWTITDSTGNTIAQLTTAVPLAAGSIFTAPASDIGSLPPGDYTISASLVSGAQEADRIDGRVRIFDPARTFQPDQRIVVAEGRG